MNLDLSDYVDKLKARVRTADKWIECIEEEVRCPKTETGKADMLLWMDHMRKASNEEKHGCCHDLASE
jgi:hypothetical protein